MSDVVGPAHAGSGTYSLPPTWSIDQVTDGYAQVSELFQDGFGSRTLDVDPESGDVVEVLSFAPALVATADFSSAVGERVARLARVRHTLYARTRRLDRPSGDALRLLSDRVAGWRLADVLAVTHREKLPLDISTVLALLRQLIPAVALFSRHQRDATIGTIGPERLILTPQGRLVLAEYVLAPGVETLHYSRERLWRDLRVALPHVSSPSRIPPSADAVGIGVVALSLLLGRRLEEEEFLVSPGELVESLLETSAATTRKLSAGFATWLKRALQFDENTGFQSTQELQISFEEMLAKERSYVTSSASLDLFIARFEQIAGAPPTLAPRPAGVPLSNVQAAATEPPFEPEAEPQSASAPRKKPGPEPALEFDSEQSSGAVESIDPLDVEVRAESGRAGWINRALAAITLVAVVEAVVLAWLMASGTASAHPPAQVVIRSQPTGARVMIDEEDLGATPLTTSIAAGTHTIGVRVGKMERFLPVQVEAGVRTEIYIELSAGPDASARPGKK